MDQLSQERLERIIAADKNSLLPEDLDFLRARRSYLNDEQLARYAEELGDEPKKAKKEKK